MADAFDPYHKWLSIPPEEQPPTLYRLLGVKRLESDPDVIEAAADRQMTHLRTYQAGEHGPLSQQLLNEVAAARVTLLNAEKKAEYDARLREELETKADEAKSLPVAKPLPPIRRPEQPMPEIRTETAPAASAVQPAKSKKSLSGRTIALVVAGGVAVLAILLLILTSGDEQSPGPEAGATAGLSSSARQGPVSTSDQGNLPPVPPPATDDTAVSSSSDKQEPGEDDDTARQAGSGTQDSDGPTKTDPPADPSEGEMQQPDDDTAGQAGSATQTAPVTPKPEPEAKPEPEPEPEPSGKPAVPSGEAQKKVVGQLEEVYEISKLKKPSEKIELAKKLIELGGKSKAPAEQFVLLRTAMELAGEGGDAKLMLDAVDQIAERFEVEPLGVKKKVLAGFAAEATNSAQIESFIKNADTVIDQAMADGQFDLAADLADRAYRLCQRSSGRKWRKQTYTRRVEVRKLQQAWQKNQEMLAKLRENPDDPEANLAVGRWYCFEQGDWQKGLPHLAKSSDAELKAVAKQELESPPADSAAQLKLADAWWKLSESQKGDEQTALMLRAGTWYSEALPGVTSTLMRTKVERRLAELNKLGEKVQDLSALATDAPQGFSIGRWVDILGPVNLPEGVVEGEWKMTRQGLATGPSSHARIALPVTIEGDYDLKVNLTRVGGNNGIFVLFPVGPNAATLFLTVSGNLKAGLYCVDGQRYPDNPTVVNIQPLVNGRPYSVAISVRTEGENAQIGATLNNRPLFRWSGKTSALASLSMPTKNQPGLGARASTVVFHSARLRLVSGEAKLVKSVPQFRLQKEIKQPGGVSSIALSPDGSLLAVATENGGMTVCDLASGRLLHTLGDAQHIFRAVAFHPKGSSVASGGYDKAVKLWDPATGKLLRTLIGDYKADVYGLAFNRDGSLLAIGSGDTWVDVVDFASGEKQHRLDGHGKDVPCVAFNPTGSLLASGDIRGVVKIWDLTTDKLRFLFEGHTDVIRSLAFTPNGATLASGSLDKNVRLWDPATGKLKQTLDTEGVAVFAVSFSPDGSLLAATGNGGKLLLWETATYELQQSTTTGGSRGTSLVFTPDGNTIITGASDKLIRVWTRAPETR